MPLTEAEIIRATQDYIARNNIVGVIRDRPLHPELDIVPLLSVLLAYEEEMRLLHEKAGE